MRVPLSFFKIVMSKTGQNFSPIFGWGKFKRFIEVVEFSLDNRTEHLIVSSYPIN